MSVHGLTINRYIKEAKLLGIDPENCDISQITDDLCSSIAGKTSTTASNKKEILYPRDIILLTRKR